MDEYLFDTHANNTGIGDDLLIDAILASIVDWHVVFFSFDAFYAFYGYNGRYITDGGVYENALPLDDGIDGICVTICFGDSEIDDLIGYDFADSNGAEQSFKIFGYSGADFVECNDGADARDTAEIEGISCE